MYSLSEMIIGGMGKMKTCVFRFFLEAFPTKARTVKQLFFKKGGVEI
jgi:hypothetical protein